MKVKQFQAANKKPTKSMWLAAFLWDFALLNVLIPNRFRALRFCKENSFKFDSLLKASPETTIDVVIVATRKDFITLPAAIRGSVNSLAMYSVKDIRIIVPEIDFNEAQVLLKSFQPVVQIISENELIGETQRTLLREFFGERYGWALQQFLNMHAVLSSEAAGVLIVDADTVLLKSRNWLAADGSQLLFPTWDYQYSYYDFLHKLGISAVRPSHYFVSHHMLMQPRFMKEALLVSGCKGVDDLISRVCEYKFADTNSPFCVKYEFYGQFMWEYHRDLVHLAKWSNLGVSRESFGKSASDEKLLATKYPNYASVSLHSYL